MSYELLVKELFLGDIKTIRQQLKDLTESERKALWQQFTPLIDALDKIMRDPSRLRREYLLHKYQMEALYDQFINNRESFLRLDWIKDHLAARFNSYLIEVIHWRNFFNRKRA